MDRIHQIRDEAARSKDITLDTSSLPSESFLTANESSSEFYSLTEEDSTFIVSPSKESSSTSNANTSITDTNLICNLSTIQPIQKSNDVESFKIGKQIEAANILSGGVNIFDDNSYDGDELIIDDNPLDGSKEIKGDENEEILDKTDDTLESGHVSDAIPSKETEVVLQIDGKNVDAIDIGNGLYLYRKTGEEELAAVQIIDDDHQQPSFKFLKVRENAEGNLEVYEEIEIEVPKEMPVKEGKPTSNISQMPTKDVNKKNLLKDSLVETTQKSLKNDLDRNNSKAKEFNKSNRDVQESKSELNFNGKTMKFNDSRKSPVISTFTPMTYHSTPNKEGRPLTKTMVDQHLQPNRHSENVKKTIEVTTDSCKQKVTENVVKNELIENKTKETLKMPSPETTHSVNDKICLEQLVNPDNSKVSKIDKDIIENKDTKVVKNNNSDENEQSINDYKITPDAITLPNDICNSESSVKFINREVEYNAITNVSCNSTQSEPTVAADLLSYNTETDIDDKLVIAEDVSIVLEASNEPITNPVKIYDLPNSKAKCEVKVSDLDSVLESCENIVKKIEESEKCVSNKIDVKTIQVVKEIPTIDKDTNKAGPSENILQVFDTKEEDKERSNSFDSTKKDMSMYSDTADKNKTLEKIIGKSSSVILDKKDCAYQQTPEEVTTTAKSLHLDAKPLPSTNIASLTQIVIEKTNNKGPNKQLETTSSCKVHSKEPPKIEKTIETKTKVKKDPSLGKYADNKVTSKVCPAVPFGKWTEANRQEFLNKIKESKVTTNNLHAKQIKQPNDLNRRDFLNKIDSQRQANNSMAAKTQDNSSNTFNVKSGSVVFKNTAQTVEKQVTVEMPKITPNECLPIKSKTITEITKNKPEVSPALTTKLKLDQRKEINNQDLIDKTIEGIINRALPAKVIQDEKLNLESKTKETKNLNSVTLDDIERKMNELHGIPFVERPSHELPGLESKQHDIDNLCETKKVNSMNIAPNQNKSNKETKNIERANISDEEIIEHEPITGDIAIVIKDKKPQQALCSSNGAKKESIITEKDFDKFVRRSSVTYENRLTINFDKTEPHNVKQSIVPKDLPTKKMSRNELMLAESKAKSTHKHHQIRHSIHSSKIPTAIKSQQDDSVNKNYQSKVQLAYQTALTAKRQHEPVTIIEDKPVKVVFMETNPDFGPVKLNVQGQQLSPSSKSVSDNIQTSSESVDSNVIDLTTNQNKSSENRSKAKHQRKQVLTPVETPELELIEPNDLGLESSLKKKRRVDEKCDKKPKALVPKKSYLLNRNIEDDKQTKVQDHIKISNVETVNRNESYMIHSNPISAIDNLVKAAELLETQSENKIIDSEASTIKKENTPTKRGRGRPRKYPLPGSEHDSQTSSPGKKDKPDQNNASNSQTDTEDSSDDEIIKENWTMGKINENIVCPICNKLFRSENVVFKHVKHCTGPSPNRSESDKRRSYRLRHSNDGKRFSVDSNSEEEIVTPRKRKSRDSKPITKHNESIIKTSSETSKKPEAVKPKEKKLSNIKNKINNLVCELCGKTFRQLSYLLSHKLQHKREEVKNSDNVIKNIFSCEVCKKAFRKLHHLVQHRLIHDPKAINLRQNRKSSSEANENKQIKTQPLQKETEDHNTGFRCEPCDKSFRKLHHLVEHRETHDGINKKITPHAIEDTAKTATLHQCDTCNKTFKKLQYLMEHKDQHYETSSEKSDDKSVQSSLSTRDIIHECSLCYMVFPNEHSLNKHFVNCQRKKKQSVKKQLKTDEEIIIKEENIEDAETDTQTQNNLVPDIIEPMANNEVILSQVKGYDQSTEKEKLEQVCDEEVLSVVTNSNIVDDSDAKSDDLPLITKISEIADKTSKIANDLKPVTKTEEIETIIIPDTPTPKKRTAVKEKLEIIVPKKQRIPKVLPIIDDKKDESSDDDEVRYMLNPNYQDIKLEEKFMKVRAEKRSSLQIERPNSKDLAKRRISLQHPPKIPRLKTKVEAQPNQTLTIKKSNLLKTAATDSDDSDIKYSFPKTVDNSVTKTVDKAKRKSIGDKRKSLTGVAKRKSLGKQKIILPAKLVRKRAEVEHRCDCGQLFSSAALLSRHTTLAHTPPRIRKRRSPPPENPKPKQAKPAVKTHPKQTIPQKNAAKKQNTQTPKKKHTNKNTPQKVRKI